MLREKLGLIFNLFDLVGVYNVSRNSPSERRFLSMRSTPKAPRSYLIDHLPDSDPWANDFIEVQGKFEFGPEDDGSYPVSRLNTFIGLFFLRTVLSFFTSIFVMECHLSSSFFFLQRFLQCQLG